jgi:GTPase SAR1 family protein
MSNLNLQEKIIIINLLINLNIDVNLKDKDNYSAKYYSKGEEILNLLTLKDNFISKLLFLGDGRVGKTSLCKNLKGEDFNLNEIKTEGIEISKKEFKFGNNIIEFEMFDFSGQEEFETLNLSFPSNELLFNLILFKNEIESEKNLNYWIESVSKKFKNSKIILICTHGNDFENENLMFDKMKKIQNNYKNNIIKCFITDSYSYLHLSYITELKEFIMKETMKEKK